MITDAQIFKHVDGIADFWQWCAVRLVYKPKNTTVVAFGMRIIDGFDTQDNAQDNAQNNAQDNAQDNAIYCVCINGFKV